MVEENEASQPRWKQRAKIAAIVGAAIGALALLPRYLESTAAAEYTLVSILALLIGTVTFWMGRREYRQRQLIRDTPTSKVRSLAVGAAEIVGNAEPVDGPLTSPLTNTPACLYELEVTEHVPDQEGGNWVTVLRARNRTPFRLADGTGEVRVEPEEAEIEIEAEEEHLLDAGDHPPETLARWVAEHQEDEGGAEPDPERLDEVPAGVLDNPSASQVEKHLLRPDSSKRNYSETVLASGEETYVFGGVERIEEAQAAENARNLVVREHEATNTFLLSDRSPGELAHRKRLGSIVLVTMGLVGSLYGGLGLLRYLGVI